MLSSLCDVSELGSTMSKGKISWHVSSAAKAGEVRNRCGSSGGAQLIILSRTHPLPCKRWSSHAREAEPSSYQEWTQWGKIHWFGTGGVAWARLFGFEWKLWAPVPRMMRCRASCASGWARATEVGPEGSHSTGNEILKHRLAKTIASALLMALTNRFPSTLS